MKSRRHVIYHKHQSVACMIGLTPAPYPLVHNHVHPPPFFLRGRKTKPCPQPLTPSLTTLDLFIFQMACGTPKIVLAVPATVTGRSAQLMVAEPTLHAHPSKELLMAAAQASKIASTLWPTDAASSPSCPCLLMSFTFFSAVAFLPSAVALCAAVSHAPSSSTDISCSWAVLSVRASPRTVSVLAWSWPLPSARLPAVMIAKISNRPDAIAHKS